MMWSIAQAQLADFGRTFVYHIWNRIAGSLVIGLLYCLGPKVLDIGFEDLGGYFLYSFFVLAVLPAFAFTASLKNLYISLDFTRPIATWQLVCVPLGLSVFIGWASFVVSASICLWLANIDIPVAELSSLSICGVCCTFAAVSTPATSAGRGIGGTLAFLGITGIWLGFALGEPGSMAFINFGWIGHSSLAFIALLASIASFRGIELRRRGGSMWGSVRFQTQERESRRQETPFAFRGRPWLAQFWYEFHRTRKWLQFCTLAFPLGVVGFVWLANLFDPSPKDTFYCLFAFSILGPLVCQIIASILTSSLKYGMTNQATPEPTAFMRDFDATRPLRSDQLIAIKLLVVTGWALACWGIGVIASLLYLRLLGDWETVVGIGEEWLQPVSATLSLSWWFVFVVCGSLFFVGTAAMLLTTIYQQFESRPRALFAARSVLAVLMALFLLDMFTETSLTKVWTLLAYLAAFGIAIGCCLSLRNSLTSRLLSTQYLGTTLFAWCIYVTASLAIAIKLRPIYAEPIPLLAYLVAAVAILMPLVAACSSPVGLAKLRHG